MPYKDKEKQRANVRRCVREMRRKDREVKIFLNSRFYQMENW